MADDSAIARQRRHLHDALAAIPDMDPEIEDGAYLTSWVTVAVFLAPDGGRWFCTRRGADGGESDPLPWETRGLLQYALDGEREADVVDALAGDEDDDEE